MRIFRCPECHRINDGVGDGENICMVICNVCQIPMKEVEIKEVKKKCNVRNV